MRESNTWFKASDGAELFVRTWQPSEGVAVKGVIQIHHGMAEHGGRYERYAQAAVQEGFVVVCHDMRAHGKTAERANPPGLGSTDVGPSGLLCLVEDMKELIRSSRHSHSNLPVLVLGHSLGSIISQLATGSDSGVPVEGVILSGPPSRMSGIELGGLGGVMSLLSTAQGTHAFSSIPDKLTFQKFQAKLLKRAGIPGVTGFEWLSRDVAECKKYQDDPHCGHLMSNGWFKGLVPVIGALNTTAAVPPANVPVMVIQGESDTCGINDFGTYACMQINALFLSEPRKLPPKVLLYGGARHELLNETNRDEVTRDTLQFFQSCVQGAQRSKL